MVGAEAGVASTPQSLAFDSAGDFYELDDPYVDYNDELIPGGGVIQVNAVGPAAPARTFNYVVAFAVDPVKNLYVLDADSVTGATPSPTHHVSQFAYNGATPTRTFESSGTAIGLSSVPKANSTP